MAHLVGTYMTQSPVTVERGATLARALEIMVSHGFRHLPIVEGRRPVGIVSERELRVVENMHGVDSALCVVADFILGAPYTVSPGASLREVAQTMAENKYGSAIVVDGGEVVGVFTTTDALRALAAILGDGA